MLRNYFRIAWRNIRHNKLFAFISMAGLTLASPMLQDAANEEFLPF